MKFSRKSLPFRIAAVLFAVSLLVPACADAPAQAVALPPVRPTGLPAQLQAFINDYDRYFRSEMAATQTPGAAVVIVKGGEVVFLSGYGVRAAGAADSVDAHTVFRIGSLSKGFAGILTGMLVQDSVLDWEEKVQRRFPEFTLRDPEQARRIRLWHLLSHTTGLPYHAYTNLIERGFDTRRIITEYFPKAPVSGKEGVFFSYQNAAFCAIEEVMLGATGKNYQQLISEKIFSPAGMLDASCAYADIMSKQDKALPHFQTGAGWRSGEISKEYYNSKAAGGVNASIADMGEWLKLLLGHRPDMIDGATLDKVFSPIISTSKERRIFPRWLGRDAASYALGWRVLTDGPDTVIYHGGYVNGFKGEIAFNRRDDIGICVLFNAHSELGKTCIPEFFQRWKLQR